jgi:hypothetical protein
LVRVAREAGAHEDVENVMDMQLGLSQRQATLGGQRPRQI